MINSFLNQDYEVNEIIVVDDGSDDNTYKIIKDLSNKNNKIKALRLKTNVGKAKAQNAGFFNSTGDFIAIIGGDDYASKKESHSNKFSHK